MILQFYDVTITYLNNGALHFVTSRVVIGAATVALAADRRPLHRQHGHGGRALGKTVSVK